MSDEIEEYWSIHPRPEPASPDVAVGIDHSEHQVKKADLDYISLVSGGMQGIFTMWVEVMREVAQETLDPRSIDLFFRRFATEMEDWEERAQRVLAHH